MCDRIPGDPRRDGKRDPKAVTDVVLTVGLDRHVRGHDEGVVAGGGNPVDQRLDARIVARQIGLIPGGRILAPDVLQRDQGRGAEIIGTFIAAAARASTMSPR